MREERYRCRQIKCAQRVRRAEAGETGDGQNRTIRCKTWGSPLAPSARSLMG